MNNFRKRKRNIAQPVADPSSKAFNNQEWERFRHMKSVAAYKNVVLGKTDVDTVIAKSLNLKECEANR